MNTNGHCLHNYRIQLFPGRFFGSPSYLQTHNNCYREWKNTWLEVFQESNMPQAFNPENFLRQDVLGSTLFGEKVVGIFAASFFNMESLAAQDHPYLQAFPQEHWLADESVKLVMSSEYLSVLPEHRKSKIGFSLGEVQIGLLIKIFIVSGAQRLFGTARKINKVDEMCDKFGYTVVGEYKKYGHPCVAMMNTPEQVHPHPDTHIQEIVDRFWLEKLDFTWINQNASVSEAA